MLTVALAASHLLLQQQLQARHARSPELAPARLAPLGPRVAQVWACAPAEWSDEQLRQLIQLAEVELARRAELQAEASASTVVERP